VRTVPLPPTVVNELRQWKLKCPKKDGKLNLVSPNGAGNVENHTNIARRGLIPIIIAAGLTTPVLDEHRCQKRDDDGKLILETKYTGSHTLRHFFASWCINR
jgi:integrase